MTRRYGGIGSWSDKGGDKVMGGDLDKLGCLIEYTSRSQEGVMKMGLVGVNSEQEDKEVS